MRRPTRLLTALLALSGLVLLGACQHADADMALLESPAVGDIYAAQLSGFSRHPFTDDARKPIDPAYGLMQVVSTDPDGVVVVTQNTASAEKSLSHDDIRGDLADIEFDEGEQIAIGGAELVRAHADGLIFAVKRPTEK
ncbi:MULTISPECIES: hypothetical protein [Luteimonas]|nr:MULTISPECIES: hypothetical protein [Luteimonas]